MSIPTETTVLVVGGGPAGSYTASALAREGVDVVVLEADVFPRYHIGESMLPSMRHFLRFIDLDDKFNSHGFYIKKGAMFKLSKKPAVYTDFVAAGGPNGYAWNIVRSEADDLMFRHAGESGAKIFDGVKVNEINFEPLPSDHELVDPELPNPGRPVSATWSRKDGSSGTIKFEYLVDASGRSGIVSTKHYKNRRYNEGLKNIASWGYWKGTKPYGIGHHYEGAPYFEALQDASGWVWTIPLSNGTTSVGVVRNQAKSNEERKKMGNPSLKNFYLENLKLAPGVMDLLEPSTLISDIKSASDWSYSANTYASPYVRIAGDAGCFIDPFFSSGVHLALASGLSAAVTICAAKRGDVDEKTAWKWHSAKVADGYTRFLIVVLSALRQIEIPEEPVISDFDEEGFERAFGLFRPVIQGTVDVAGKLTQDEISKTIDFCFRAFQPADVDEREALYKKLEELEITDLSPVNPKMKALEASMSPDELRILNTVRARQLIRSEDTLNIENFGTDTINGMAPKLERGSLTLVKAQAQKKSVGAPDAMAALTGQAGKREEEAIKKASYAVTLDETKPPEDAAPVTAAA